VKPVAEEGCMVNSIQTGPAAFHLRSPEEVESYPDTTEEVESDDLGQCGEVTLRAAVECTAGLTTVAMASPTAIGALVVGALSGMKCGLELNDALECHGDR
jgi:hypothetical protein